MDEAVAAYKAVAFGLVLLAVLHFAGTLTIQMTTCGRGLTSPLIRRWHRKNWWKKSMQ